MSMFKFGAFVLLCSMASLAHANDEATKLRDALRVKYPSTRIDSVSPSPFPGFYEVVMGSNIAYVEQTGRYFLFGVVFDMSTQKDLTAERVADIQRIDFSSFPLADAVKTVKGSGRRLLAVFTDPDCGYCRRLEPDLDALDDVTIYRFIAPLQDQEQGRAKVRHVWCANNRDDAWRRLIAGAPIAVRQDCDDPAARNVALMQRLGLSGTPSLVAADGRLMLGAQPATQISAWLDSSSTKPVSVTRKTLKE